jgi:methyl-accepting chemotaxis protein
LAARQTLTGIVTKIAEIDVLISEIATSSQEQATGPNEVNTAVNQMDRVTQQNAAMVEEATAASPNLKTETGELERLVSRFQTGEPAARLKRTQPGRHAPASNPVARAQARITAFARPGGRRSGGGAGGGRVLIDVGSGCSRS